MANRRVLHFSLGPVQGFVEQARRTRDLWAGSFLLSWLAGKAMQAVRRQGGQIVFPSVVGSHGEITDPVLATIEGQPPEGDANLNPTIGSLPNRFKAEVGDDFNSADIATTVRQAWCTLADAVCKQFIAPIAQYGDRTQSIWQRQIDTFWEISWVVGEADGTDHKWLDARKNWRDRWPEPEGGDHCTIMGDFQELSGFVRAKQRHEQDAFWEALRSAPGLGKLDFRPDERLCAVALVKRLFPKLPSDDLKGTIGWVPGGKKDAVGNWPSTAYMSAVPWLGRFEESDSLRTKLEEYERAVIDAAGNAVRGERASNIRRLEGLGKLAWLDGNFFIESSLANERTTPLTDDPQQDRALRGDLRKRLQMLNKEAGGSASPFYAFLLMDGDKLGVLLGKYKPEEVSAALRNFTKAVNMTIVEHDGVTLYAGGDDVLAMLPIDKAIKCATALKDNYREAFRQALGGEFDEDKMTASTAVIFTQYHLPLRSVLREAHHQLDEIAKDKNGRDSLALALLKSSGKSAEWVAWWQDKHGTQPPEMLSRLVESIKKKVYSTGFFYNLRARYPMLVDESEEKLDVQVDVEKVLVAEFMKGQERKCELEEAQAAVNDLLAACSRYYSNEEGKQTDSKPVQLGGAFLARFLAKGGLEP